MSEKIRVAVLGADGRMGTAVCEAVAGAADLELVARMGPGDDPGVLTPADADVAVDFTTPAATEANVHALLDAGLDVVVGTSGWTADAVERVRAHVEARPLAQGVLIAPNFALSAVLTMRFARQAAAYFESAEIIELHHPDKADAPSGTATATAQAMGAARAAAGLDAMPDATTTALDGARGADVAGVPVHSVRLRGLVAHQEVLLGNPGEQLTIRTDSFDRASFMPGVLLAVRRIGSRPGLTVGLEALLDL
ncbi:4-hydroxy-tetrahydrodipicolinate reductase [Georgenia faecalis]|uniref:4-hydroxy-tetrahydrodipicolinate reductase n=1 Tax=Georgenia faecalis TaxID=2483799 RepID=A0ABV9DDG1_9MICO|nr:4-hydroxy-tetrahydrodipicolinate reductase [Georgenia faecalis]